MARSRRMKRRPILLGLGGGLLLAGLLTLVVCLSNGVVNARCEIEDLRQRRICLEAEVAERTLEWNRAMSRHVICERASREIDLVPATDTGVIVVATIDEGEVVRRAWRRAAAFIDNAGGLVRTANAAER